MDNSFASPWSPTVRLNSLVASARDLRLAVDCSWCAAIFKPTCGSYHSYFVNSHAHRHSNVHLPEVWNKRQAFHPGAHISVTTRRTPAAAHLIQLGAPFVVKVKLPPERHDRA